MKLKAEKIGVISVISPLPGILAASWWGLIWISYIVFGVLGYDHSPEWALIVAFLPAFVSPAIGVFGVIYGLIRRRERGAVKGILLSALGLLENALLWYWMSYIGSRY